MKSFTWQCWSLLVFLVWILVPPPLAAAERPGFTFTNVDLKLLAEVELLDQLLEKEGLVYGDAALTGYVTRIGESLVPRDAMLDRVTWRFRVLRDPLPNAFALPNGSIYVHSGLLGVLENEDQLASVLAHEVMHVVDRHSYLSFRSYRKRATAINLIGFAGGAVSGQSDWGRAVRLIAASAQVILAATIEGYSRDLERQADVYAVDTLLATGYDAGQMASTFRLLQGTHDLEQETIFYTSHPKLQDRFAYVSERVQTSGRLPPDPEVVAKRRDDFRIAVQHVSRQNVQLALDSRRHRSAVALAERLLEDDPTLSDHAYLLAESYRALGPRTARPAGRELGSSGRKDAQRLKQRLTAAEEERTLLSRPEGQAAARENQQKAEALYRRALELDPNNYTAYRGLGLLFEASGRAGEALDAYGKYLELGMEIGDRERIRRRMDALRKTSGLSQ